MVEGGFSTPPKKTWKRVLGYLLPKN